MKIEIDFFSYLDSIKIKNEGQIESYFDSTNKHLLYTKDKTYGTFQVYPGFDDLNLHFWLAN